MIKKLGLTITCGIVAVSMCSCASSAVVLDQAQDSVSENMSVIEQLIPDELAQVMQIDPVEEVPVEVEAPVETPAAEEEIPTVEEKETKLMLNDVETEPATEATKVVEEKATEAATVEPETPAEEKTEEVTTAAEEETTAVEESTEKVAAEETTKEEPKTEEKEETKTEATVIVLAGDKATVDGKEVKDAAEEAVYISNDIVYYKDIDKYESGNAYGEGTAADKHTEKEAAANAVLNITKAGTYKLTGNWVGQIRVDLGVKAITDATAKVELVLDDVDLACDVAPALYIANVYECDAEAVEAVEEETAEEETTKEAAKEDTDKELEEFLGGFFASLAEDETDAKEAAAEEKTADDIKADAEKEATKEEVKTGAATIDAEEITAPGVVIRLADGSFNMISGSHVAKIYEDAKDADVIVEQDAAVFSNMPMAIEAENEDAYLSIAADNVGICAKDSLEINGGEIRVLAMADGIHSYGKEDAAVTVNGGDVHVFAGAGAEGRAITADDKVIVNGGNLVLSSNPVESKIAAEKSEMEINGGTVVAYGSPSDLPSADSKAVTAELIFAEPQAACEDLRIADKDDKTVFEFKASEDVMLGIIEREFSSLIISAPELKVGEEYSIYAGGEKLETVPAKEEAVKDEPAKEEAVKEETEKEETTTAAPAEDKKTDEEKKAEDEKASETAEKDLETLKQYKDVFEHFNISFDDVEKYISSKEIGEAKEVTKDETVKDSEKETMEEKKEEKVEEKVEESAAPVDVFVLTDTVTIFENVAKAERKEEVKEEATEKSTEKETEVNAEDEKADKTSDTKEEETVEEKKEDAKEADSNDSKEAAIDGLFRHHVMAGLKK